MGNLIRLQKFLADRGIASRRKAEGLILSGEVKVNGQVVMELGTKVDPEKDKVEAGGSVVGWLGKKIYIKLNKPRGYVSSCRSFGEKTILDLVKDVPYRLYPVGRLDKESEGLMILTNDGELANRLMHPRYEHEKEYEVSVKYPLTNDKLLKLSEGIVIDGKKTLPAKVTPLGPKGFKIVLKEGRKRQIRRMVEGVGNRAVSLRRIRIGNIRIGKLKPGAYEFLAKDELTGLTQAVQ
jgi:23S rRNA pseudouridine2605 synthase/23S rRNA pseudouridine2604 synthase